MRRSQNTSLTVCEVIFALFASCNRTEKSSLTLYLFTYASEHLLGSSIYTQRQQEKRACKFR